MRVVRGLLEDPVVLENQRLVWALRLLLSYFLMTGFGGGITALVVVAASVLVIALYAGALAVWFVIVSIMLSNGST